MSLCQLWRTASQLCKYIQKNQGITLNKVYALLGCTKQNVSYWSLHSDRVQARNSICQVIRNAESLFGLKESEVEALADSAGISLCFEGGDLLEKLNYIGKHKDLCERANISERMLRHYKNSAPTKQALLAILIALNQSCEEINLILRQYGYCFFIVLPEMLSFGGF